jgi:hypothetical protein
MPGDGTGVQVAAGVGVLGAGGLSTGRAALLAGSEVGAGELVAGKVAVDVGFGVKEDVTVADTVEVAVAVSGGTVGLADAVGASIPVVVGEGTVVSEGVAGG